MGLRFLGNAPNTGNDESPRIWQDEETGDLVIQGYTADEGTLRKIEAGAAPGHSTEVPPHESAI